MNTYLHVGMHTNVDTKNHVENDLQIYLVI